MDAFRKILVTSLLLCLVNVCHGSDWAEVNGIRYVIESSDGTATVDGPGFKDRIPANVVIPSTIDVEGATYTVVGINSWAFLECTALTSISLPNTLTTIGISAFNGCVNLTSFTFPQSFTQKYLPSGLFADCHSLSKIEIPATVTTIGNDCFRDCRSLTSIALPNSLETIYNNAFVGCTGLTSMEIPNSVTKIDNEAFRGCSKLTSIFIPASVASIGQGVFSYCDNLASLTVSADNATFDSRGNCNAIIQTASNRLVSGCNGTVIPNTVTGIGGKAFAGCPSVTAFNVPNSVAAIGEYAYRGCANLRSVYISDAIASISTGAFSECPNIESITVDANNGYCDSRDNCNAIIDKSYNGLIAGCKNTRIPNSTQTIYSYAFFGCTGLTSITIPNSVTRIMHRAFENCNNLTAIEVPNSVYYIGEYAFSQCEKLRDIFFGTGLRSIAYMAFANCKSLANVYCQAVAVPETEHWAYSKDEHVFGYSPIENAVLYVPRESLEAYSAAEPWNLFGNIKAIEDTGIHAIKTPEISYSKNGNQILIDGLSEGETITAYSIGGQLIAKGIAAQGKATLTVPSRQSVIINYGNKSAKLYIK